LGIPVITNKGIGDVDEIITKSKTGILVNNFSTDSYQKAIKQIPHLCTIDSQYIRQQAQQYYRLEDAVAQYAKLYTL